MVVLDICHDHSLARRIVCHDHGHTRRCLHVCVLAYVLIASGIQCVAYERMCWVYCVRILFLFILQNTYTIVTFPPPPPIAFYIITHDLRNVHTTTP